MVQSPATRASVDVVNELGDSGEPTSVEPREPPMIAALPSAVIASDVLSFGRDLEAGPSSSSTTPGYGLQVSCPTDAIGSRPPLPSSSTAIISAPSTDAVARNGRLQWTLNVLCLPWKAFRSIVNKAGSSSPAPPVHILDRIEMQNQLAPEFFARAPLRHTRQAHRLQTDRNRGGPGDTTLVGREVVSHSVPDYTEQYTPGDGDRTMPEYLWKFGFLFPPLWALGALYLKVGLHPKWNPRLETIDPRHRTEAKKVFRTREKKYARRCLGCLIVFLLASAALAEGLIIGLR